MIETKMRGLLKQCQSAYLIKFDSIETGGTTIGMPDTHFYSEKYGLFGWLELKHVRTLGMKTTKIPWRAGQLAKGKLYRKAGENVWLLISVDDRDLFLFIPANFWKDSYSTAILTQSPNILRYRKKELNEETLREVLQ